MSTAPKPQGNAILWFYLVVFLLLIGSCTMIAYEDGQRNIEKAEAKKLYDALPLEKRGRYLIYHSAWFDGCYRTNSYTTDGNVITYTTLDGRKVITKFDKIVEYK